jgi:AraC-like DNA-binding protein
MLARPSTILVNMTTPPSATTRGILNPAASPPSLSFDDFAPREELRPFVARIFVSAWSLPAPHVQALLPCPCSYLVLGTERPGVHGVTTRRLEVELVGEGWVVGVRFRPGALRSFVERPMHALRNRVLPLGDVFGPEGSRLDLAVNRAQPGERVALVERFLLDRPRTVSPDALMVNRAVELARTTPEVHTVRALAERIGVSVRVLELRFREHVGLSPKAVIRRCRVIELADAVARGERVDWSALAASWGYSDQAHLIRDFKEQVGATPASYAALCAAPALRSA